MSIVAQHIYRPRGTARALFSMKQPEILISGPAGTGKSRACLEKLHLMALKNPGMRGLIVRKTQTSLGSSALVTFRQKVAKESFDVGDVKYYGGSAEEPPQYQYTNGAVIIIGGMDKSSRIMSTEYDVIYVQEATELTEDDWEALTTRLRNGVVSFQQLIADCNPAQPTHWLNVRCETSQTKMLQSTHEENPVLFDDQGQVTQAGQAYISKLDKLSGVRYLRLRKGIWAAAEGLIYEDWDPAVHLIDRFHIPVDWPRFWSVDFGYTNPFCLQMWAEDPDGRLILYREIYHTGRTVPEHGAKALSYVTDDQGNWTEPVPQAIICDHADAEGREHLRRALGISNVPANKTKTLGIQAVQGRFKTAGDGKPRILIMRDSCIERDQALEDRKKPCSTAEEIPGYVWAIKPGGALKEEPKDEDNHGCDALRYLVAHRDMGAVTRIRWL